MKDVSKVTQAMIEAAKPLWYAYDCDPIMCEADFERMIEAVLSAAPEAEGAQWAILLRGRFLSSFSTEEEAHDACPSNADFQVHPVHIGAAVE
jgi:hypothetical protein